MSFLEITGVVAAPRVFVDGTDPSGTVVRTTIYSGHVSLARSAAFRGAVGADDLQQVAFFLPDSLPYPQPPTAIGVELSIRRHRSSNQPRLVHIGVSDAQAAVLPDPRGGEHQWLQISFATPVYSHELIELNYRVTAQSAAS